MFGDTTARNRAHQAFGSEHYGWLILLKLSPWLLLASVPIWLFGLQATGHVVNVAFAWTFSSSVRGAVVCTLAAAGMLWLKRRWRRNDYRP